MSAAAPPAAASRAARSAAAASAAARHERIAFASSVCFHCLAAHAAHTATHAACCHRANALRHRIAARHLTIVAWRRSPSSVRSAVSCAFRRIRWSARWSRFFWPRAERLSNASCTARKTRILRSAQRHTLRSARRALRRTRRAVAVPHRQRPKRRLRVVLATLGRARVEAAEAVARGGGAPRLQPQRPAAAEAPARGGAPLELELVRLGDVLAPPPPRIRHLAVAQLAERVARARTPRRVGVQSVERLPLTERRAAEHALAEERVAAPRRAGRAGPRLPRRLEVVAAHAEEGVARRAQQPAVLAQRVGHAAPAAERGALLEVGVGGGAEERAARGDAEGERLPRDERAVEGAVEDLHHRQSHRRHPSGALLGPSNPRAEAEAEEAVAEVAEPLAQQAALARVFGRVAAPPHEGPRALDVLQMLDHGSHRLAGGAALGPIVAPRRESDGLLMVDDARARRVDCVVRLVRRARVLAPGAQRARAVGGAEGRRDAAHQPARVRLDGGGGAPRADGGDEAARAEAARPRDDARALVAPVAPRVEGVELEAAEPLGEDSGARGPSPAPPRSSPRTTWRAPSPPRGGGGAHRPPRRRQRRRARHAVRAPRRERAHLGAARHARHRARRALASRLAAAEYSLNVLYAATTDDLRSLVPTERRPARMVV